MLIFLYGEDTYRSRQKLGEIQDSYSKVHKNAVNLRQIDCSTGTFENIRGEFQTSSLFREKKLIILRDVFSNADLAEKFSENKKLFLSINDTVVFFQEGALKKNSSFFRFLQAHAQCQEFSPLGEGALLKWIEKQFRSHHTAIHSQAVEVLAKEIGNDLWLLSNEIKKLVAFAKSRESEIQAVDLGAFSRTRIATEIFSTLEDISQKNKKSALAKLQKHITKGESPIQLLSMVAFQFRNVLLIADMVSKNVPERSMNKLSKIHPFVIQKGLRAARNFSLGELKKIYGKIFRTDLAMKTGTANAELALHEFIAQL